MRILLYGLGRSGLAAGRLLARQGHTPMWFERREEGEDVREACRLGWPRVRDVLTAGATTCIAAPGVPIDHPDLVALRRAGTETIGEVEWVGRTIGRPLVGITGTAGKGTVTRWTEALLRHGGIDAVAGGNVDPALAAVAEPGRALVVELSSFQLERCPTLAPRIAVVTNLGRDHLDRHGTVAAYHETKRAILRNLGPDDHLILNADDAALRAWGEGVPARVLRFSARGAPADARLHEGRFVLFGHDLGSAEVLQAPGTHSVANALAAALAAYVAGVSPAAIREALPTLAPLPGRHALVNERCGVRFVEDSIATRELAVSAALEASVPPVVWIVGGRDKGADVEPLRNLVRDRVAYVLGIGESGPRFVRAFETEAPGAAIDAPDGTAALSEAVRTGAGMLLERGGGTLLLAPLAASFDQFTDYAVRGRAFTSSVQALLEEAPWTRCS